MSSEVFSDMIGSARMARAVGTVRGDMPDRAQRMSDDARLLHATLSRELLCADLDYRSLALHAGLLHSMTIDAKQHATHLATLLCAQTETHDDGYN